MQAGIEVVPLGLQALSCRGVLDKVGVEPQVQRLGDCKSAGDQLLRRNMSEAQREQLGELLDDIYEEFLTTVAESRGKAREVLATQSCLSKQLVPLAYMCICRQHSRHTHGYTLSRGTAAASTCAHSSTGQCTSRGWVCLLVLLLLVVSVMVVCDHCQP